MLYPKCPTCATILSDIQLIYERKIKEVCSNPKLSETERSKKITEIVNSLGLERYCCKMRVMSYVDLSKILV